MRSTHVTRIFQALLATVALFASVVAGVPGSGMASGAEDLGCKLEPQLRDVTINQGLGSYQPLVRGKETLVRLFLSGPVCAELSDDYIELVGGSLTVSAVTPSGSVELTTVEATPQPVAEEPKLAPFSKAPLNNWPGDPLFVIPGDAIAPAFTTDAFTITLTAKLSYRTSLDPQEAVHQTGAIPVGSAAVERQSNPLRILFVPMGDSRDTFSSEFPSDARTILQTSVQTLSRMLPVADDLGDLDPSQGPVDDDGVPPGIRYAVNPSLLPLDKLGLIQANEQKFCGAAANFTAIKDDLAKTLSAWNSSNAGAEADLAVGVVWQGISNGVTEGCAEGWASLTSNLAWSRLKPDPGTGSPSFSGSVLGMEIAHTFGGVPDHRDDDKDLGHSPALEADGTSPGRAYNTTFREFLPNDRTVMNIGDERFWNNKTTLLELLDWKLISCQLTNGSSFGCERPGSVGSSGAEPAFVISGTTNVRATSNPAADVTDAHSYYEAGKLSAAPSSSPYKLVQLDASGAVLKSDLVPVRFSESNHTSFDGHGHGDSSSGVFEFATKLATNGAVKRIEFRHDSRTAPLYARNVDEEPVLTSATLAPSESGTVSFGAGSDPAVSADGSRIVWRRPGGELAAARVSAPTVATSGPAGTHPDWAPDGIRVAYSAAGDIWMASVDPLTHNFTGARPLYLAAEQTMLGLATAASHPTWSPDGTKVAVAIAGDIWVLDLSLLPLHSGLICETVSLPGSPCYRVTNDGTAAEPAWGPSGVAYRSGSSIKVVDPISRVSVTTGLVGAEPTWSDGRIGYVDGGRISTAPLSYTGPVAATVGIDADPSLTADASKVAVERSQGAGSEVVLVTLGRRVITVVASDDTPENLRLDVFLECNGSRFPVLVDEHPDAVGASNGTFVAEYDTSLGCDGGVLLGRITDGYWVDWGLIGPVPGAPPESGYPDAAIYSPVQGGTITQYRLIALSGEARDEDGLLDDSRLQWEVRRSDGTVVAEVAGKRSADVSPPTGGWAPGTYVARLRVIDGTATLDEKLVTFTIAKDEDHDDRPPGACGEDDSNWRDAFADPDGDGIVNADDGDACISANNSAVSFDPQTLYVPSAGSNVTMYVSSSSVALKTVAPSTVRIARVGQWYTAFPAVAWSVDKRGIATAKFDRAALTSFMHEKGLVGQYVPVVIEGRAGDVVMRGVDPKYPYTSPA